MGLQLELWVISLVVRGKVVGCGGTVMDAGGFGATLGPMQDFSQLIVWQRAQALTVAVYRATNGFATSDAVGFRSQLRRSTASIGANIAEGAGQAGPTQFARCSMNCLISVARPASNWRCW